MSYPESIFEIGHVPKLPYWDIQKKEYRDGKWYYAIRNTYNPWGSGWADEDYIIEQINKYNAS